MLRFFTFFFLLATTACTSMSLATLTPSKITNTSLSVENATIDDMSLKIQLEVENPNSVDVKVSEITAQVTTDGIPPVDVNSKEAVILKAKSKTKYGVPLTLPWKSALFLSQKVLDKKDVPYRIKGTAKVEGTNISFDERGKIPSK